MMANYIAQQSYIMQQGVDAYGREDAAQAGGCVEQWRRLRQLDQSAPRSAVYVGLNKQDLYGIGDMLGDSASNSGSDAADNTQECTLPPKGSGEYIVAVQQSSQYRTVEPSVTTYEHKVVEVNGVLRPRFSYHREGGMYAACDDPSSLGRIRQRTTNDEREPPTAIHSSYDRVDDRDYDRVVYNMHHGYDEQEESSTSSEPEDESVLPCPICHEQFRDYQELTRHQQHAHSDELHTTWACGVEGCEYVAPNPAALATHVRAHTAVDHEQDTIMSDSAEDVLQFTGRRGEQCDRCGKYFSGSTLEQHKTTCVEHLKCKRCQRVCNDEVHLRKHENVCGKSMCKYCGDVYVSASMEDHLEKKHPDRENRDIMKPMYVMQHGQRRRVYKCNRCTEQFHMASQLKDHFTYRHPPSGPRKQRGHYVEDVLDYGLSSDSDAGAPGTTSERIIVCDLCPARFVHPAELQYHKTQHRFDSVVDCKTCGAMFMGEGQLHQHERLHTVHAGSGIDKLHACDKCAAMFVQLSDLEQHKQTVHKIGDSIECRQSGTEALSADERERLYADGTPKAGKYECSICRLTYVTLGRLGGHHLRMHEGSRPSNCANCRTGLSAVGLPELLCDECSVPRAASKPIAAAKYECSFCNKGFDNLSALSQHSGAKHAHKPPLRCALCRRTLSERADWEKENLLCEDCRSVGKGKSKSAFPCNRCTQGFASVEQLREHGRTAHTLIGRIESGSKQQKHVRLQLPSALVGHRCDQCDATFGEERLRTMHMNVAHSFKCTECSNRYTHAVQLSAHMEDAHSGG